MRSIRPTSPRWQGASGIERIGHSEWSRAFGFRAVDGGEFVVRFSALDKDFRQDQLAARYAAPELRLTVKSYGLRSKEARWGRVETRRKA